MKMINVLFTVDGDWWVGECVEIVLASQAPTVRAIADEMQRIINSHFETCAEHGIDPYRRGPDEDVAKRFIAAPRTMRGQYIVGESK